LVPGNRTTALPLRCCTESCSEAARLPKNETRPRLKMLNMHPLGVQFSADRGCGLQFRRFDCALAPNLVGS
jgi:hypothetical protein